MNLEIENSKGRIVLAGGSGFLGSILASHFMRRGGEVVVLTRKSKDPGRHKKAQEGTITKVLWDGRTRGPWAEQLEGARAIINLSGRSVNCRYTRKNRKDILESRIDSTHVLGEALSRCRAPPAVWLNCSGAGIYKESFDTGMDESGTLSASESEAGFSSHVARLWERAFDEAQTPATRKVALRISMVLGIEPGTPFRVFRRLARAGLAGRMGSGKQYVSWIHEIDFCRVVDWLIDTPTLHGPINVTAPNPVTNEEFTRTLRQACGHSFGLPAADWMLEIGAFFMRTETELILKSRRVVPGRLLAAGFQFQFPQLGQALQDLEAELKRRGQQK